MAACADCRAVGGLEAERAERNKLKEEAAARDRRNFEWMQRLRAEGYRKVTYFLHAASDARLITTPLAW
jgi:hypothetical protein